MPRCAVQVDAFASPAGKSRLAVTRELCVVHAVDPGRTGGLETVVRLLCRIQAERGCRVTVVGALTEGVDPAAHPFREALSDAGVSSRLVSIPGRAYPAELRFLRDTLRDLAPDVVHTHGYRADVLAGMTARRLGLPVVGTAHGFTGGGIRNRLYEWLQRRAYRRFDAVVAVSDRLRRELRARGVPEDRLHCVPNGWTTGTDPLPSHEAKALLDLETSGSVAGFVGRLSWEKGPDILVEAASLLKDLPLTVALVGEGREREHLKMISRTHGLDDRVAFCGLVPGAERVFSAFDVFVLSSRREGTPMALFEAIEAGVPVVATAVGGVPDVVSEEEAVLVAPEDPAGIAEAIRAVLSDPSGAAARARRARGRLAREFGPDSWFDEYRKVYREAIRHRADGA